tara:strand:+ start:48102 stop:48914 length:813 start_codon:yes stop_codon:yes gene_type:complete
MKIAVIGGTHGNEPVGIEVMKYLKQNKPKGLLHEYECFLGNPRAYEEGKRYIDTDLNRSFGKNGERKGYEGDQSAELVKKIEGKFDFILDLHTTTSNMGLTLLLNNDHENTRNAAAYLKELMPEIKIIEGMRLGEECPYTNNMAQAGLTVEVGPVANNVLDSALILATNKIVTAILEWDFKGNIDLTKVEHFKSVGEYKFPKAGQWYVHPSLERADFKELHPGDPVFINMEEEVLGFEYDKAIYPYFVNEAAYLNDNLVMTMGVKRDGFN